MSQSGILTSSSGPVVPGIETITGNTGGAISPTLGNVNIIGATSLSTSGAGSTLTISLNESGFVKTLTGNSGGAISPTSNNINISGSHGINLVGAASTLTATINNSITLGDITPISGADALTIDSGDISILSGNFNLPVTTSSTEGVLTIDSLRFINTYAGESGSKNVFIGYDSGNLTLTSAYENTALGVDTLSSITTGGDLVAIGWQAGKSIQSTESAVLIGAYSGWSLETGGYGNVFIGDSCGYQIINGEKSVLIGQGAGNSYTSNESNNILIGYGNSGTVGESNVLRIGTADGIDSTFIQGVFGVTSGGDAIPVVIDSANQLGTVVSSKRFKENIEDLSDSSSFIFDLRPVRFNLKSDEKKTVQIGLIAEEVEKVCPGLVVKDADGNPFTIKYQDLPILMLNELKKLRKEVDELRGARCCQVQE